MWLEIWMTTAVARNSNCLKCYNFECSSARQLSLEKTDCSFSQLLALTQRCKATMFGWFRYDRCQCIAVPCLHTGQPQVTPRFHENQQLYWTRMDKDLSICMSNISFLNKNWPCLRTTVAQMVVEHARKLLLRYYACLIGLSGAHSGMDACTPCKRLNVTFNTSAARRGWLRQDI